MTSSQTDPMTPAEPRRRRLLRAVFAADLCNFGGLVSVDETRTLDELMIARRVALEEIARQEGTVFGLPGDGIFALFESALGAVKCALAMQSRLAAMPKLGALRFRVGLHVGEVLFEGTMPFGESIVIAARLESLADPGGILVSGSVMEATASRVSATFAENGVQRLKHSPRRIATYKLLPAPTAGTAEETLEDALDVTAFSRPLRPSLDPRLPRATPLVLPDVPVLPPDLPHDSSQDLPQDSREDPPRDSREDPPRDSADDPPQDSREDSSPDRFPIEPVATVHAEAVPPEPPAPKAPLQPALDPAALADLAKLLISHIGPVAGIVVRRQAATTDDPHHLVEVLAEMIPSQAERGVFRHHAELLIRSLR